MPKWTKEQEDAIISDGENIIVSAGAGSGKTAVLTSRVIRKLESGVSINQLLILTFTKAAANEMKVRIRNEIKNRMELSSELKKIDSSYITTFDSFSLSLVKKYHYLLNIKKNVELIESNLLNIKMQEYLDIIMEEEYLQKEKDFVKLINDFCIKDDTDIKSLILAINDKLNLKYNKNVYLDNYVNKYYSTDFINEQINKYLDLLKNITSKVNNDLTKISYEIDSDYYYKLSNMILPIINSNSYLEIRDNVNSFERLPNLPRASSENAKRIKEKISERIKLLKELTRFYDTSELINSIMLTKPYIEAIIRIIQKLDNKISEYKYENDLYDFIDIAKMAIKLVKEHDNIRKEVQESFNEIMVDEYQDTSDLQEEFISLISQHNVYVVGDVKQSIYRFRNANPNIFRNKYNLYAKKIGGKKIDLLKNFRSRGEVLNNINLIFNYIMSEFIGGADYINDHQMIPGNSLYLTDGDNHENNNLDIYSYDYDKNNDFTKEEIEAFIIAWDINNKITNHYQVFDKKSNKLREATYGDFAILIDRSTNFELFKKIFLYQKIPLSIYKDEYLTNSSLFMVIRNIFKLINLVYEKKYNKEMEYAYLSIGRSFLFDYDDEYLFKVITDNTYQKTIIFEKVKKITNNLSSKSISIVLDEIISEFDIYEKLRRIPDIVNNYIKLEYLYTLSSNLNKMGYNIQDFDIYLEDILKSKTDLKFSLNKEDGDSVKVMTIHASKGLEYPICYFPLLYKDFNDRDLKEKMVFSDSLGIITPYYENGIDNTFYHELFKNSYYQDEISEKIRLFYVALTRAREKMIFVIPNTDFDDSEIDNNLVADDIRLNYRSFLDMINSIRTKLTNYIKNIDLEKINLTKNYNLINSHNLFDNLNIVSEKIIIENRPKFDTLETLESHFSKSSMNIFTNDEKMKMDFGTKMHYYLENLDLKNPDLSDIASPYQEKIELFLKSALMKNVKEAKVYQEYEFIDKDGNDEKHGVIDLMLEYSDYIDIIDYKLKNILDDAYVKQLNGYRDYIKKISNKEVHMYLYSIIDSVYKEIEK